MPLGKMAQIRYLTLDKCLRNRQKRYTIRDLTEACIDAINEHSGETWRQTLSTRQVYKDLIFMQSEQGYGAEIESILMEGSSRKYWRYADPDYSITKQAINDKDAAQLRETLITLQRFKGLPQFDWIPDITVRLKKLLDLKDNPEIAISFDDNPYLEGLQWIEPVYYAIVNKQSLIIDYHPFDLPLSKHLVSPYLLKQFNKRWFVLSNSDQVDYLTNLALDRIVAVTHSNQAFIPYPEGKPEEFFEDIIGVTRRNEEEIQDIVLEVEKTLWPYIKTKPLHDSQKEVKSTLQQDWVQLSLQIKTNYEFYALILSHGGRIRIIEPLSVREKIKNIIKEMSAHY